MRAKFCECPPSIAYDASVNGAPPNPMSGTPWGPSSSRRIIRMASSTCASASRGSKRRSRSMSASVRSGFSIAGPSPRTKSNGMPIGSSGSRRSENRMAASTSMRRTGCIVTRVASSGQSADVQQRVVAANFPVLGHVAPGLPHEPDGGAVDRLAPARLQKTFVHFAGNRPTRSRPEGRHYEWVRVGTTNGWKVGTTND